MASNNVDWDQIFHGRIAIFKPEEQAFALAYQTCTATEYLAEKVYEAIKGNDNVPARLKIIYQEGLYGSLDRAKTRVRNRIGTMKTN